MKRDVERRKWALALGLVLAASAPVAWAGGADEFQLSKAIPADVYLAACARSHDGQAFLNKQYERLWAEVEAARFDRDFKRLFKSMQQKGGGDPAEFDKQWQQVVDLCASVDFDALTEREFAFAIKLGFPTAEFAMLMLPAPEKAKEQFDALSNMVKSLIGMAPETFTLDTSEEGGNVVHRISLNGAPFPLGITLARHGETVVLGFGTTLLEQIWTLLNEGGTDGLVTTARFKEALGRVPAPADGFFFFDMARLLTQIRGVLDQAVTMATAASMPAEGTPEHDELMLWKNLPGKLVDTIDIFEYFVSSSRTDGMKTTSETAILLKEDAKSRPLYGVLFGNKGFSDPLKYVPDSVGDFSVSTGFNVSALYKAVIDFIRKEIPEGESVLAHLAEFKEETGFDLEQDIIGWMEGRLISFSVPGPTPYSPGEFVMMISTSDEQACRGLLDKIVEMVTPMIEGDGQSQPMASIKDAEIEGAPGFRSVIVPTLAMFGMNAPTIGVKDGWLMIGSSPEILTKALDVAAGKAPNFGTNARFKSEGIAPAAEVIELSFTDMTKLGEELGQVLQMVPMIGMAAPDLMKEPVAQAALSIIGKLGRVVRKLDFFQSSASMATFDGKLMKAAAVVTYREPPAPKVPASEGAASEPASEGKESEGG